MRSSVASGLMATLQKYREKAENQYLNRFFAEKRSTKRKIIEIANADAFVIGPKQ